MAGSPNETTDKWGVKVWDTCRGNSRYWVARPNPHAYSGLDGALDARGGVMTFWDRASAQWHANALNAEAAIYA